MRIARGLSVGSVIPCRQKRSSCVARFDHGVSWPCVRIVRISVRSAFVVASFALAAIHGLISSARTVRDCYH